MDAKPASTYILELSHLWPLVSIHIDLNKLHSIETKRNIAIDVISHFGRIWISLMKNIYQDLIDKVSAVTGLIYLYLF